MNVEPAGSSVDLVLDGLTSAVDALVALELDLLTDEQFAQVWQRFEVQRNRLVAADLVFVAQASRRHSSETFSARSAITLTRDILRISAGEAKARVDAAAVLVPHRSVTGVLSGPTFDLVADAHAAGEIGVGAAKVVVDTMGLLPDTLLLEDNVVLQAALVEQARTSTVDGLRRFARQLLFRVDPDGRLKDVEYREKRRGLVPQRRDDGSYRIVVEATAECGERFMTAIDALATSRPEVDGLTDTRTMLQLRHDALLELTTLATKAELLPRLGGVTTTVTLTMTHEAWVSGQGIATTGNGTVLPMSEAQNWIGGDARVIGVVLNDLGAVEAMSDHHRIATEKERIAMTARDGGCSFPNCDMPARRCESHHVVEYQYSKRTSIDGMTLLCHFHHREFQRRGWSCVMLAGVPHWKPPKWIDPEQKPLRNKAHRPELR